MTLLPADYALLGIVIVFAVLGLFRGFSGTLAFFVALGAAVLAATLGWRLSPQFSTSLLVRGASVLVGTLLVFGLVRFVVKRTVNGLLSQPSDAIFGFFVGAATGSLAVVAWAVSGMLLEYSALATEVAGYVR